MRGAVIAAAVLTVAALAAWRSTGGDAYTKFEVMREVQESLDPSDPLLQAGFYAVPPTKVVREKQFRLGLLPTPSRLVDKHAVSVVTIVVPLWGVILTWAMLVRRTAKRRTNGANAPT